MSLKSPKTVKSKAAASAGARRVVRKSQTGQFVAHVSPKSTPKKTIARKSAAKSVVTIRFGSVTMQVMEPSKAKVKENVKAGASALARVRSRLLRGGITITPQKDVPLFRADPDVPNRLVRELNGELTYGTFVNGKFKPST